MAQVWLITGSARGLSRRRVVDSLCIDQPLAGEQDGKLSAVQPHPGPAQATDPRAVPLEKVVSDVMRRLGESTSEIILDEVRESRWAERTGLYDALFAKRNEGTG